jgi:phage terminase large subunit GpA-like protein
MVPPLLAPDPSALRTWHRVEARLLRDALAPRPRLSVSEWADRYRVVSEGTSTEAGEWRTDRAPYLKEIMDAFSDPAIWKVVFKKPAQVGGTEVINNVIGYHIDQDPCAILVVQVSLEEAKKWSKEKLAPMLRDSPRLVAKVQEPRGRDPDNTLLTKSFPGGHLGITGANAPSGFRQRSRRVVLFDDVDGYPPAAGREGDQLVLGGRRTATFWNRKVGLFSTPTIEGFSRIDEAFREGDRRRYVLPCPACGHKQQLLWLRPDGGYGLVCERDAAGDPVPASARYACIACGTLIPETEKRRMLRGARWIAERPTDGIASFELNALVAPWVRWSEVMREFLDARRSPLRLQGFVNTMLGETWREEGAEIEPHALAARVEPYEAELPRGVGLLTAGVDVQGDRLEVGVYGWGAGEEGWLIRWAQLDGDPGHPEVWRILDELLLRPWRHAGGAELRIVAAAIDSGYQTEQVYRFAEPRRGRRVHATKGVPGRGRPLWAQPGPSKTTKAKSRHLVLVGVDSAKDLLHSRLRIGTPGPGYLHFPDTTDRVFFEQLTAERLVTKYRAGRPVREWTPIEGRRNEALDVTVLALAALAGLGPSVIASLGALAEQANAAGEGAPPVALNGDAGGRRVRSRGVW